MRKVAVLVAALAFVAATVAVAGDYHYKGTLNCAECHVMHGSMQHGYNANGGGTYTNLGGAAPYNFLLRNEPNALCLTCHDNTAFAPDVMEANGGTAPALGRQAGGLNITTSAGPYYPADGHTLGSAAMAPGGAFTNPDGLECIDCHSAHGRGGARASNPYRNLYHDGASISYAVSTDTSVVDVFERTATGGNHYDIGNVDFNEPDQTKSYYGEFCKSCHTNFHGSSADANMRNQLGAAGEEWLRHPTADANIGALGGGHSSLTHFKSDPYRVKVMSASMDWGTQGVAWAAAPADLTPSCFSCHKGHGNQRAYGLIYPDSAGTVAIDEQGAGSQYRNLCKSCHAQG